MRPSSAAAPLGYARSMLRMEVAGEPAELWADKAMYLPRHETLLVADAHVGKAASYRRWGVPVPRGTTAGTLGRLSRLLDRTGARRVVFLGDLMHSERSDAPGTMEALARWRERHAGLGLTLVRGNHDARAGDPPPWLGVECVDEPLGLGGLALCHEPQDLPEAYVLCGHLHPCVRVAGRAREWLRLPCYWFGTRLGVLPAFGEFTGMMPVRVAPGDRLYAIADDRVLQVPG